MLHTELLFTNSREDAEEEGNPVWWHPLIHQFVSSGILKTREGSQWSWEVLQFSLPAGQLRIKNFRGFRIPVAIQSHSTTDCTQCLKTLIPIIPLPEESIWFENSKNPLKTTLDGKDPAVISAYLATNIFLQGSTCSFVSKMNLCAQRNYVISTPKNPFVFYWFFNLVYTESEAERCSWSEAHLGKT